MSMEIASHISTATPSSTACSSSEAKSPTAFRTIGEVADDLKLPQHVLRFWESKFQQIKPLRRGDDGRRYYRPADIRMIQDIKELLYNQGFTIRGVQKLLKESGHAAIAKSIVATPQAPESAATPAAQQTVHAPVAVKTQQHQALSQGQRREMEGLLAELKSIRNVLKQTGI